MALEVNGARGEVALKIGDVDLVIAAEMVGLANLSTHLKCESLSELFLKLSGVEPATTMAAIQFLTVRGDKAAALKAMKLSDFKACAEAFSAALAHHFEGASKNEEAKEATTA